MAITNGYTSLATLKTEIGIADINDDTRLENIITAVSREIDHFCKTRFYVVSQTRTYTAREPTVVWIDHLTAITSLKTDADGDRTYEDTWASTDYDLAPYNAALESQVRPYSRIEVTPTGNYIFPVGVAKGVQVIGSFGWSSSTPPDIERACILLAIREFKRPSAPFGVQGSGEFGQAIVTSIMDPDVVRKLRPFQRKRIS